METKSKNSDNSISRRKFLAGAGGLTFVVAAGAVWPRLPLGNKPDAEKLAISAWVHLDTDGQVTIFNPASEMGQGSMSALAVLIAEEMDADWSRVTVENSPMDPDIYGLGWRPGGSKSMLTVGSRTVRGYYNQLRQAGAQVRYVLLWKAAKQWEVPINELITEPGLVKHVTSNRQIAYAEIASTAEVPNDLPEIPLEQLKDPSKFRLIGKYLPRFDIPEKIDGSAQFAIDVQLPDMVYGVITRSPVHGSKPTLANEDEIRSISGVLKIVPLDHGIGVIAESMPIVLDAKKKLQINWSNDSKAATHNSDTAFTDYAKIADQGSSGQEITNNGNVDQAFQSAAKKYSYNYTNEYVYHAQMEPLNAVVSVAADRTSAEVWVGTQGPDRAKAEVADVLGLDISKITLHPYYLGGGFGRRSMADYVREAALLAKEMTSPVKLIWTREDDLQYGAFRPMSLQRMQASVDEKGSITGWQHQIIGPGGRLLASGANIPFYSIANQKIQVQEIDHGIRTQYWRSVGHGPNKFAIEAFIDEIAADQNINPLLYRKQLMQDAPRALKVLETTAEMANWGAPLNDGHARGLAFAERSGSLSAAVCEISLNESTGKIKVHHIWAALDAGVVVQPDNAKAQMEGNLLMGLGSVLTERISFRSGTVEQSNYHDYSILRMADTPETVNIKIIASSEPPAGIGEAGLPAVGGAVANAFASLTGKRLRHMPFTSEQVLKVLKT
ncbi:MAG: molybdopterin cofactor-binding domain-containing protein [Cyclobacteriaceae bacterium]